MPYQLLSPNVFNCAVCETRCDGKTVMQFDFERDVKFSEKIENEVINFINATYPNLKASKTTTDGYPDIEIKNRNNEKDFALFIEIKGQARTFMSVAHILPQSGLQASETLALNLSDLERYFLIKDTVKVPVFIVWCLMRRPCIVGIDFKDKKFFFQEIDSLKRIRLSDTNNSRRFRRATGKGDVVNGEHKGVVVNYHFSINELNEGLPNLDTFDLI